jgi:hypothetical protein
MFRNRQAPETSEPAVCSASRVHRSAMSHESSHAETITQRSGNAGPLQVDCPPLVLKIGKTHLIPPPVKGGVRGWSFSIVTKNLGMAKAVPSSGSHLES